MRQLRISFKEVCDEIRFSQKPRNDFAGDLLDPVGLVVIYGIGQLGQLLALLAIAAGVLILLGR